jgi:hypothetical protein
MGCLRYYCKSYDYGTLAGAASFPPGASNWFKSVNGTSFINWAAFPKYMAKIPTVSIYNWQSGAINSIYANTGTMAVTGLTGVGAKGFGQINVSSVGSAVEAYPHFTADTGW